MAEQKTTAAEDGRRRKSTKSDETQDDRFGAEDPEPGRFGLDETERAAITPEKLVEAEPATDADPGAATAAPVPESGSVQTVRNDWAELIDPRQVPDVSPQTPAPPPGKAPPGDSRSFRRREGDSEEFCLVYRHERSLVTRRGAVGVMGTWKVVEYPSVGSAAHAYAQESSQLAASGFRDVRGN